MSTTIVEKDSSSSSATAILIFVLFAALIVGGVWFAYTNGMLGKSTVIENTKVVMPAPSAPAPAAK